MFEMMTFENIMESMLGQVTSPVDKREGSLIWDALAPAAAELAKLYAALEQVLQEGFADTASREYLILRASERGMSPRPASPAVAVAKLDKAAPVGCRFCCDRFNWRVVGSLGNGEYYLECEESGSEPNGYLGRLVPLEYVSGLGQAELVRIEVPGEDEESTESLRGRYLTGLLEQSFGGNRADYIEKALSIAGVGAVKVQAAWAGGGTVRLILLDDGFCAPGANLVERVQQLFDPRGADGQSSGQGLGLAPIGHRVTVIGAEARAIGVAVGLTLQEGYEAADVLGEVSGCIEEYFAQLSRQWAEVDQLVVRVSQLEARILELPGVLDVSGLTLDGEGANLLLEPEEIPALNALDIS